MKKFSFVKLTAVVTLCLSMSTTTFAQNPIQINHVPVTSSVSTYIKDGYTMVTLRALSEQLGCKVGYESSTKTATVEKNGVKIIIPINSRFVGVNGYTTKMETSAEIKNGSTMVPLRFIVESLGGTISYDATTKTTNIDTSKMTSANTQSFIDDTDAFGNKIRTTNLPTDFYIYPYIREDVPNWVYSKISSQMNNNAFGPNQSTAYYGKRFLATSPAELYYNPDSGIDMWLSEIQIESAFSTARMREPSPYYEVINDVLEAFLNIDGTKVGDPSKASLQSTMGELFFSHFTIPSATGIRTAAAEQYLADAIGSTLRRFKNANVSYTSEFTPLYECTWASTDFDGASINLPVYVKLTMNSHDNKSVAYYGSSLIIGNSEAARVYQFTPGETLEGVVNVKLIKHKDYYLIDYSSFNLISQLLPTVNYLDSLKDEYRQPDKQINNWSYIWTRRNTTEGALTLQKYQSFDTNLAKFVEGRDSGASSNKFYTYTDLVDNGVVDNPIWKSTTTGQVSTTPVN